MSPLPIGTPTVAIVGAGQLARMMQPPAVALGIQLRLLAQTPTDCAAAVIPDVLVATMSPESLARVADGVNVLTVEHEHVDGGWLTALAASGVAVHPSGEALHVARDKAVLRQRLHELGMPQPRWSVVSTIEECTAFGDEVGWPFVLKPSRGGYDGRGVHVVQDIGAAEALLVTALPTGAVWLAEEFISFEREVAAQVARSASGQVVAYPLVRTLQRDGMCAEVVAPCPESSSTLAETAAQSAIELAVSLDVVGMLAVEMYVVTDADSGVEQLLVNEIAMRPHNSGHWSIDGATTSQFENHLRAVLDLPLGDPQPKAPFAVMVNVIGGEADNLHYALLHCQARDPEAKIHIYGKEVRLGRKIGHVTILGDSVEHLLARARHLAGYLRGDIHE